MDLSLLSKYRTQLMGFSILMIVFYHFFNMGGTSNVDLFLRKVFSQGYVGVDFFMFASGLGLTFSLSKTECLKDYYIKRWVRIFPFFTFITLIECFIIRGESLGLSFLRSTTIGYFVKGVPYIDWFIPALVGLYMVYPILYFKVIKPRFYKKAFFLMLFFIVLSCLASIFDILDWKHFALLYRIPIFILGAVTSSAIKYGYNSMLVRRVIVTYAVVGSIVAIISKLLAGKNVIWLINAAFVPLYLYLLMNIFSYIHKKYYTKILGGQFSLSFYGAFTLELYRVSSSFERLLSDRLAPNFHWLYVISYFLLSVMLAWLCHIVFERVNAFLYRKLKIIF